MKDHSMDPLEIISGMLKALNELHVPYMIVGSLSSNFYGEPRMTKDADFVVQLGDTPLSTLSEKLGPTFRIDRQLGFETVTSTTRYHVFHTESEFMIELFELTADPHNQQRFSRRRQTAFAGVTAFVPTAEDVLIQKLRWYQRGHRQKDIDDAANVLDAQRDAIDLPYIRHWTDQHGTRDLFEKLLAGKSPAA
jgi:hypothetical protein